MSDANWLRLLDSPFVLFPVLFESQRLLSLQAKLSKQWTELVVRSPHCAGMEVSYQLHGTESGPFSATTGTCPAFGTAAVTVRFAPKDPLMFHKRLFLLIRDHAPLAVNLIGSCFNDKVRPPLLSLKQFSAGFRNGSSVQAEPDGHGDPILDGEEGTESPPETNESGAEELERWEALFASAEERTRVRADVTRLDFGACARGKPSEFKPVTLTNDSEERVTCTWMAPEGLGDANPAGSEGVKLYQVFPQEAEIRPGGSFIFNVVFRPKRDNCYYCDDLEVLVVPKGLRQWDAALTDVPPPSVLKLRVREFSRTSQCHASLQRVYSTRCPVQNLCCFFLEGLLRLNVFGRTK